MVDDPSSKSRQRLTRNLITALLLAVAVAALIMLVTTDRASSLL